MGDMSDLDTAATSASTADVPRPGLVAPSAPVPSVPVASAPVSSAPDSSAPVPSASVSSASVPSAPDPSAPDPSAPVSSASVPSVVDTPPLRTAADVLLRHLTEQVTAFHQRSEQVRERLPEGVHKMRVASRQLRSSLSTFRRHIDRQVTDPIRDELAWFAALLGEARDPEVIRLRLLAALADDADDSGAAAQQVDQELSDRRETAHDAVLVAMQTERFARLVAALDQLVAAPPFTRAADQRPRTLRRPIRRRMRQISDAMAVADSLHGHDREHALHEVRKSGKRLRYASEVVIPVFGDHAIRTAADAERIQGGLGDQQDTLHAREYLADASSRAGNAAVVATLSRLHDEESAAAELGVAAALAAWADLRDPDTTAWLRD